MNALRIASLVSLAASVLALAACKIPGSETVSDAKNPITAAFVTNYSGDFNYKLDVGSGSHDVYFVFSNKDVSTGAGSVTVKDAVGPIKVNGETIAASSKQPAGGPSASSTKAKDFLARSNRDIGALLRSGGAKVSGSAKPQAKIGGPSPDANGDAADLYDIDSGDNMTLVLSTCQNAPGSVATAQGDRRLNIYVADACWNPAGGSTGSGSYPNQKHLVTQAMVDALEAEFLTAGLDNDIYDWETAMLGPEWGAPKGQYKSQLISPLPTPEITILLSDIEQDNSDNGGIVGYFWAGNNFKSGYMNGSNERIMFVIDSDMFANPSTTGASGTGTAGWDASTSYWARECFSTLAHEFQHMIEFYRKGIVVRGDGNSADTWINEMCSQLVEDLVARKVEVEGPRGVAYDDPSAGGTGNINGRIPYFNQYLSSIDRQLTKTSNYDVLDYSFSYAFGAWLARNYGGAQFVRRVVYSSATDSDCLTGAVKAYSGQDLSLGDLIQRWAVAVLGSGRKDMPVGYRFNTGAWTNSKVGDTSYSLGSINFFNYSPKPQILTGSGTTAAIAASSNVYYRAAAGMTGDDSWKLSLPVGVAFSVYVTP